MCGVRRHVRVGSGAETTPRRARAGRLRSADARETTPDDTDTDDAGDTIRLLVADAGPAYAGVAFGLPVVAATTAVGLRDAGLRNLVHVVAGSVWAGAAVFLTGVLAPTLGGLEPDVRGPVNTALIPKAVLLFAGVAVASPLTGPALAVSLGLWRLSNPSLLVGVSIGVALLALAGYVFTLQLRALREVRFPGPTDQERIGRIAARVGQTGPVVLGLQLAALVSMALVRTGGV